MEIKQQMHGAVTSVKPMGPVTGDDADALRSTLLRTRTKSLGRLVLDASSVPFVDSVALEALLDVTEELGQSGQALKLCGANELIREVLELTGLAPMFEHYADVRSAVRSFM
ncbi:MAG: STAS domain-containing protein [Planctomycetes bacterium]|nr:STAS domain-containing protein [Planctomycetota bacterium]